MRIPQHQSQRDAHVRRFPGCASRDGGLVGAVLRRRGSDAASSAPAPQAARARRPYTQGYRDIEATSPRRRQQALLEVTFAGLCRRRSFGRCTSPSLTSRACADLRPRPISADMRPKGSLAVTFPDLTIALFSAFNVLRLASYLPQIIRIARDQKDAPTISC